MVVGAGPIGAMCALELAQRGAAVTVIERGSGWGSAAVAASAGWVCPSFSRPFATRRDITQATRWLLRDDAPLALHRSVGLAAWIARFVAATGLAASERAVSVLSEMALDSFELYARLSRAGVDIGFEQCGLIDVFRYESTFARARRQVEQQHVDGGLAQVLDVAETRAMEPALGDLFAGAILYPDEAHCDPQLFTAGIGAAAVAAGTVLVPRATVLQLEIVGDRVVAHTTKGVLRAERGVIAAGVWSGKLTRALGMALPIMSGKGYGFDIQVAPGEMSIGRALYLHEARVALTPLSGRVRVAGTLELGARDGDIDWRRLQGVRREAARNIPALRGHPRPARAGLRPLLPDGLPALGTIDSGGRVIVATGHAMLGVTLAPATASFVADLLDGGRRCPALDPSRFKSWRPRTALA